MGRPSSLKRLVAADFPAEQRRLVEAINPFLASTSDALGGALTFDNLNVAVRTLTVTMPQSWFAPTLATGWVNSTDFGCMKTPDGTVKLRGDLTGGTYGTTPIFNLPTAYRPPKARSFAVAQSSLMEPPGLITIATNGDVVAPVIASVQSGASTYLSLDGIAFEAADLSVQDLGPPFPIVVSAGHLSRVTSLSVLSCYDVTSNTPVAAPYPNVSWGPDTASGSPVASIKNLVGLAAGRSYQITVILYPF